MYGTASYPPWLVQHLGFASETDLLDDFLDKSSTNIVFPDAVAVSDIQFALAPRQIAQYAYGATDPTRLDIDEMLTRFRADAIRHPKLRL